MIQLAFDPAFDPFHCAFRILRQVEFRHQVPVRLGKLKILDVYLAEPVRCREIRLPATLKKEARLAASLQRPYYGQRPGTTALFDRMSPMQDAAIQTLVQHGLLDGDAFSNRLAVRTDEPLDGDLKLRVETTNEAEEKLMHFLFISLDQLEFDGFGGLKDRTGLGEHRYDVV
jgi:hypothetical protein